MSANPTINAPFKNVIFAGGGSRCFWQVGFWDGAVQAGLALDRSVDYAASTSAGCALATVALLNRGPEALVLFKELTASNPKNIYWANLMPGANAPVFPHFAMYREGLEQMLTNQSLANLADKKLEFLIARYPRYLRGTLGIIAALLVYSLEKSLIAPIHPTWAKKLGFQPLVCGNHEARDHQEFIDMILAASCVPPLVPQGDGFRGEFVLDGGLIDNVPAFLADQREGRTLILLSRRFQKLPSPTLDRVYVQPSEPIPIDKFDYTNPTGLQEAYDLGVKDGRQFASSTQAYPLRSSLVCSS